MATTEEAVQAAELLNGRESLNGCVSTHAFHTRLMDTSSSKFSTELFQVKYCKLGNTVRHLVGLREVADQQSLVKSDANEAVAGPADADDSSMSCPYRLFNSVDYGERSPVGHETSRLSSSAKSLELDRYDKTDRPIVYLFLDMESCCIGAASVVASSLVGMKLAGLFPGRGFEILQALWAEVDRCEDASELMLFTQKQHFFREWLVQWSPSQSDFVDGVVEILQSTNGSHGLLLRCKASVLSSPSSGGAKSAEVPGKPPLLPVLPGMPFQDKVLSLQ